MADDACSQIEFLPTRRAERVGRLAHDAAIGLFCRVNSPKAVFLDRDGTIILDQNYISDPLQVGLLPGAKEAITLLREADFMLFLFTNQSGVGRGYFPLEAVLRCNARMLDLLGLGSPLFTDVCIAPESPEQPAVYRKPSPRFIDESVTKHGLDRSKSWMVGDKAIDAEAGVNAGINAALIGKNPCPAGREVLRCESLLDFARTVASQRD